MKLIAAMLIFSLPASAHEIDLLPNYDNAPAVSHVERVSYPAPKRKAKARKPAKRKTVARKAAPKADPTRVMAYEERGEDGKCYRPLTVVGSQWIGEAGAYESSVKAMKELIRWQIGEVAMDPGNWKDVKRRCSMSSVGEVAGQVFHRCEITATPCRPAITEATVE